MYTCYALKFQCYKNIIPQIIYKLKAIQNKILAEFFKKSVEIDQPIPTFL